MKIILSPTKTMKMDKVSFLEDKKLLYPKQHKQVLATLRKLNKNDLAKALSIKGDILNNTYQNIRNYSSLEQYQAFPSFTGLVFFNIDKASYQEEEYNYITQHLRILDAFHGILEPGTLIKPYRIDMKSKIGLNLYTHWDLDNYFRDEVVINLASTEFSKMVQTPMININFLQHKNGKYINQATYSKQARGMFLDYLVKNKIQSIEEMKEFVSDNYHYNKEQSNQCNITFTR